MNFSTQNLHLTQSEPGKIDPMCTPDPCEEATQSPRNPRGCRWTGQPRLSNRDVGASTGRARTGDVPGVAIFQTAFGTFSSYLPPLEQ